MILNVLCRSSDAFLTIEVNHITARHAVGFGRGERTQYHSKRQLEFKKFDGRRIFRPNLGIYWATMTHCLRLKPTNVAGCRSSRVGTRAKHCMTFWGQDVVTFRSTCSFCHNSNERLIDDNYNLLKDGTSCPLEKSFFIFHFLCRIWHFAVANSVILHKVPIDAQRFGQKIFQTALDGN